MPEHDAAQAHWGEGWRMPTYAEQSALVGNCILCKYVNGEKVKDLGKAGEVVHLYAGWRSSYRYQVCFNKNDGTGATMI